jgi:hypothetical protein
MRTDAFSYRKMQWLVVAFASLHNAEEALTMPAYAPLVRERMAGVVPAEIPAVTSHLAWFYGALIVASVVPALVVMIAVSGPASRTKAWAVLFVQALFLVNVVVPHVPAALLLGGYVPGLLTAVLVELPFSIWFLRRSVRDGAVSKSGAALAVGLALPALLLVLGTLVTMSP